MMNKKSFTLIELLLGLVIFSLIGLTAYSVFSSGIKIGARSNTRSLVYREAYMALDLISRDLENMVSYDFSNSYKDKRAFIGREDSFEFILAKDQGLRRVKYYLTTSQDPHIRKLNIGATYKKNVSVRNVRRVAPRVSFLMREEQELVEEFNDSLTENKDIELIAAHVKEGGLTVSYLHLAGGGQDKNEYLPEWDKVSIPTSVQINLKLISGENENLETEFNRFIMVPAG